MNAVLAPASRLAASQLQPGSLCAASAWPSWLQGVVLSSLPPMCCSLARCCCIPIEPTSTTCVSKNPTVYQWFFSCRVFNLTHKLGTIVSLLTKILLSYCFWIEMGATCFRNQRHKQRSNNMTCWEFWRTFVTAVSYIASIWVIFWMNRYTGSPLFWSNALNWPRILMLLYIRATTIFLLGTWYIWRPMPMIILH